MEHKLNHHAQLTKLVQLELKITDLEHNITIYHQKMGFFPLVGKFALFMPDKTVWHNFAGPKEIMRRIKFHDNTDYEIYTHSIQPDDFPVFEYEGLGENVIKKVEDAEKYIWKILKAYQLYASIEYEK